MRTHRAFLFILLATIAFLPARAADELRVVTLDSPAPLVEIKVMVKAGSAADPQGLEGLAQLTGRLLIEGGFGDPKKPVTKDRLAEITRPWGGGAYPSVRVSKEVTTFSFTVPKEVLDAYLAQVLAPLFAQPLFAAAEVDRVRGEVLQQLRSMRLEQIELVGLVALDTLIHHGTSYAHPDIGTEKGLEQITREAVERFYATYYKPENIVIGLTSADPAVVEKLRGALTNAGESKAAAFSRRAPAAPSPAKGRSVSLLALPNAISSGIHAGFPLAVTRADADYWPLYIANIWFGAHRDSFGNLYTRIREHRGYNYGDYSYIEHFESRPFLLFPPTNTPRRYAYFSIWIRPVAHEHVAHLTKALTWELENFIRTGLSEEQCAQAKNKARVLYLSLAETADRWIGYRLDDDFYGMHPGYLDAYLERVNAVTCAQVNAAIKKHLQAENVEYLIVTNAAEAPKLAEQLSLGAVAWGKAPAEYQIDVKESESGGKLYEIPEAKLDLLRRDAAWANYWLDIPKERIKIVPVEKMFVTANLPE
jgi:zinc protease